jgi:hypothetical protein
MTLGVALLVQLFSRPHYAGARHLHRHQDAHQA